MFAPCLAGMVMWSLVSTDGGTIVGRIVDAGGATVAGASVVLCDAASGLPVVLPDLKPYDGSHAAAEPLGRNAVFETTGADGSFRFDGLPPGTYRLVAQSWARGEGAEPITDLLAINGETIHLRGVAEVALEGDAEASVTLRPLGDAVLVVDEDVGNDETLLVVSTGAMRADPILGFAGWGGPFVRGMIGANRMPGGRTVIRGLPEGVVYLGVFAADNVPGFGAATVDVAAAQPKEVTIPFVVSWSDGVHSPPPALEPLCRELAEMGPSPATVVLEAAQREGIEIGKGERPFGWMASIGPHLDREVTLTEGRKVRLGDLMAAAGYVSLQQGVRRRHRMPNPYREAEVRVLAARP